MVSGYISHHFKHFKLSFYRKNLLKQCQTSEFKHWARAITITACLDLKLKDEQANQSAAMRILLIYQQCHFAKPLTHIQLR